MTSKTIRIALILVVAGMAAPTTRAAEACDPAAVSVRDDAISKIVAWRAKSGESTLKKKVEFEETQPWLTAEALLMATYGVGQDEDLVNQGLEILTTQAKKAPEDPVSEFYRGDVLNWIGKKDEAKQAWQNAKDRAAAAVKADSKNATARFYLGASLVRLNKPGEARKALKKAAKDGFDKPMVDFQIGLSYMLEDNWKAAKSSFDDVHELDPRYAHLYFYRALAWDKLGHKDRLFDDLDQFVKLAPNSPEAKTANAILKR
jgi:tetratricopeptide (TPR) repeat protein